MGVFSIPLGVFVDVGDVGAELVHLEILFGVMAADCDAEGRYNLPLYAKTMNNDMSTCIVSPDSIRYLS